MCAFCIGASASLLLCVLFRPSDALGVGAGLPEELPVRKHRGVHRRP